MPARLAEALRRFGRADDRTGPGSTPARGSAVEIAHLWHHLGAMDVPL